MQAADSFLYEKEKDGAVILRCFLRDGYVEIPETLDGLPVTALAPYAFSAQQEPVGLPIARKQPGRPAGAAEGSAALSKSAVSGAVQSQTDRSGEPLCGNALRRIVLPSSLQRVGRYCFYNCENLTSLQIGNALVDWGSGAFAGCHQIRLIRAGADAAEAGSLQHLLSEISEELTVLLGDARLVFPEYYEEAVENTPARILQVEVHGTGNLYRNCFRNGKFDFAQYDSLFPYAEAQESEALLDALVTGRLRYPYALKEEARSMYLAYGKTHSTEIGKTFLREDDAEGLNWYLDTFSPAPDVLDDLCSEAARQKDAQLVGILMEYRQKNGLDKAGRKRLIL